ncbi:alpha/beta fold hydrolase [Halomicrococcus sp. NG-SE-24]|uniref:alpha/beta fold hydrolase n=1 Tax=Halomicrococcus sp. NG-SE-24 TaxID=3436928 RepID=UPI003D976E4C
MSESEDQSESVGETPDSPPTTTAETEFEAAQRHVFDEAGIGVQSRYVNLERPRSRLHVFEAGDLDSDEPPVVFIHGTGGFGAFFAPLMAHLDDLRLIAIDRPGCGLSDKFVYTTANHRQTVGDVLAGVLDDLEVDRADIVGNSTGGYWSLVFALTHPQRVRRAIPIGGVPTFPGTRPPVPLRLFTVPVLNRLLARVQKPSEENVVKFMEMAGEGETIQRYPALIRAKVAHDRIPRSVNERFGEFKSFLTVRRWRAATRLREAELRDLQHPTMFIWGEQDFLGSPNDVRESVEVIPDAHLVAMDAGHGPWLGQPAECAQLIREMRT